MAGPKIRKKLKKKPKDPGFGTIFLNSFAKLIKQGHSAREAANLLKNKGRD